MDEITIRILDWIFGGVMAMGSLALKALWSNLKALQNKDEIIDEKVRNLEVLVAGNYVPQERFDKAIDTINSKLDTIEHKLDKKLDRFMTLPRT